MKSNYSVSPNKPGLRKLRNLKEERSLLKSFSRSALQCQSPCFVEAESNWKNLKLGLEARPSLKQFHRTRNSQTRKRELSVENSLLKSQIFSATQKALGSAQVAETKLKNRVRKTNKSSTTKGVPRNVDDGHPPPYSKCPQTNPKSKTPVGSKQKDPKSQAQGYALRTKELKRSVVNVQNPHKKANKQSVIAELFEDSKESCARKPSKKLSKKDENVLVSRLYSQKFHIPK